MDGTEGHQEMSSEEIYDALMTYHLELDSIPPETHLFCPKVNDDDLTNYEELDVADEDGVTSEEKKARVKAFDTRQIAAYYLSLLMGISVEHVGSWLQEWSERTEGFLSKCDACVRTWHRNRAPFIRMLRECVFTPVSGHCALAN